MSETRNERILIGKETMGNLEKGLRNKHQKKVNKENLLKKYPVLVSKLATIEDEIKAIELQAGFYDKKNNIFENAVKEDKEKIKQIVGDIV